MKPLSINQKARIWLALAFAFIAISFAVGPDRWYNAPAFIAMWCLSRATYWQGVRYGLSARIDRAVRKVTSR